MKNITKFIILLPFVVFLIFDAYSKKEEKETYRTVSYFNLHTDIRDKRVSECKSLKEITEISAKDCANANASTAINKSVKTSNWY